MFIYHFIDHKCNKSYLHAINLPRTSHVLFWHFISSLLSVVFFFLFFEMCEQTSRSLAQAWNNTWGNKQLGFNYIPATDWRGPCTLGQMTDSHNSINVPPLVCTYPHPCPKYDENWTLASWHDLIHAAMRPRYWIVDELEKAMSAGTGWGGVGAGIEWGRVRSSRKAGSLHAAPFQSHGWEDWGKMKSAAGVHVGWVRRHSSRREGGSAEASQGRMASSFSWWEEFHHGKAERSQRRMQQRHMWMESPASAPAEQAVAVRVRQRGGRGKGVCPSAGERSLCHSPFQPHEVFASSDRFRPASFITFTAFPIVFSCVDSHGVQQLSIISVSSWKIVIEIKLFIVCNTSFLRSIFKKKHCLSLMFFHIC